MAFLGFSVLFLLYISNAGAAGAPRNVSLEGRQGTLPHCLQDAVYLERRAYMFEHAPDALEALGFNLSSSAKTTYHSAQLPHPPLLPLRATDVIGFIVAAFSLFLAAGGGIGGGGVIVPIYMLILHFSASSAVALSNLTIAGGALANFLCNIRRQHPSGLKPLIDWDLILVMEPLTICGAIIGGFLNKLLPAWVTDCCMAILLVLIAKNLWTKAITLYRRETLQQRRAEGSLLEEPILLTDHSEGSHNSLIIERLVKGEEMHLPDALRHEAQEILVRESEQVPLDKLAILFGLFGWLLATDTYKSSLSCGSWLYWLSVLSILPLVLALLAWFRGQLVHKGRVKAQVGLAIEDGEIEWNPTTSIKYPLICSFAGIVAGLFGVGGGIVKGPLMLEMGVIPEVAAATSATMILFTSGSASVVYLSFGGIPWGYASVMIVGGFIITLIGQMLTYEIIHRLGRRSIIIFAMGSLLAWGFTIMLYESFAALGDAHKHGWFRVEGICGVDAAG